METIITNQQNKIEYDDNLKQVIMAVVDTIARIKELPEKTELSIMLVDNDYIKELNLMYRGKNEPTDVLSFAMNEMTDEEPGFDVPGDVNMLGDIVVSLEQAKAQSIEYEHSLEREVGYLIVHGMLHLLGYDHKSERERKVMRDIEKQIMKEIKLER